MRYYDDEDANYQELHKQFFEAYGQRKEMDELVDILKHCNNYSLYVISRYLSSARIALEKKAANLPAPEPQTKTTAKGKTAKAAAAETKTAETKAGTKGTASKTASKSSKTAAGSNPESDLAAQIKSEIDVIDKIQIKITPIFLKKWMENCVDRRIIFDYIKVNPNFNEKQKRAINETFGNFHSIGYIKHFLETVDFADSAYIDSRIKFGSDYCLKYEYGLYFPEKRKEVIAAMRKQAEKSEHAGIIKQYADELKEMKNAPPQDEPKMF